MNLLNRIVKWIEDKRLYQRERKTNEQRALGMLLYNAGLSYKKSLRRERDHPINHEPNKRNAL